MGKHGTGKIEKNCSVCMQVFIGRIDRPGLFCSRSCKAKTIKQISNQVSKDCVVCKTIFSVRKYREKSALYCSVICRRKIMPFKEEHINWKGGISERPYSVRKKIKSLIAKHGKCFECGSIEELQGHHIKPYSEFPELGCDENNIIILCCYCHAWKHPTIKSFILKGVKSGNEMDSKCSI